ncbi:hypothetical protein HMPREF1551_01164 [Capnocytophaga sp. oral taxon 863 str. F0517]|nr:hypothetical protein HMPREF1551_01164 [Capnocytophaga sp. oral taxon 863 str. F0517]
MIGNAFIGKFVRTNVRKNSQIASIFPNSFYLCPLGTLPQ